MIRMKYYVSKNMPPAEYVYWVSWFGALVFIWLTHLRSESAEWFELNVWKTKTHLPEKGKENTANYLKQKHMHLNIDDK